MSNTPQGEFITQQGLQDLKDQLEHLKVVVRKEEEFEPELSSLAEYEEIWIVDNEVASVSFKMKLRSLAKKEEVSVKTFYGEVSLHDFLRQQGQ